MYIGIISPNFSGSTVIGSILHRYETVQHVGEWWKIFSDKQTANAFCKECHPKPCPFFSEELKSDLRELPKEMIVSALQKKFRAKIIVSGDKRPYYFKNFTGMPDRALVLIKNKYAAALSYAKRIEGYKPDLEEEIMISMVKAGAIEYFDELLTRIQWARSKLGNKEIVYASPEVIIDLNDDELVEFGKKLFGRQLSLKESNFDNRFHYIGGNHKISKGKDNNYFQGRFRADKRYESVLSESGKRLVDKIAAERIKSDFFSNEDRTYLEKQAF